MAQVRQEAPSGPASLLDTVLEGDPERLALLAEAETAPARAGGGARAAARHRRRRGACPGRRHPRRARLRHRGPGPAGQRVQRRLAHAGGAGDGAVRAARPAAAGRADQPPGPRGDDVAGGLARPLPRRLRHRQPRPRPAGPRRGSDRAPGPAPPVAHTRRLHRVRPHPHRAGDAAGPRRRADRRPARPHAGLRGPVPRQGHQGAAGAIPAEGAGAAAGDGERGGGTRHALRLPRAGAARAADPAAGAGGCRV